MWICMPTMMHSQSGKSSTKYTTTCLHSAEVETPPTSRQNYSYPGFLRRNLRELQPNWSLVGRAGEDPASHARRCVLERAQRSSASGPAAPAVDWTPASVSDQIARSC